MARKLEREGRLEIEDRAEHRSIRRRPAARVSRRNWQPRSGGGGVKAPFKVLGGKPEGAKPKRGSGVARVNYSNDGCGSPPGKALKAGSLELASTRKLGDRQE
jgi:hypothetical protein